MEKSKKYRVKVITLIGIIVFAPYLCFCALHRDLDVWNFRNQLCIQGLFIDPDYIDEYREVYKRYSFLEMYFSLKPLKTKCWFTEEECKKYKLHLVDEICDN